MPTASGDGMGGGPAQLGRRPAGRTWLLGIVAAAGVAAGVGGLAAHRARQDRAARAANRRCVAAWERIEVCRRLVREERGRRFGELRAAGAGVAEAAEEAAARADASDPAREHRALVAEVTALAAEYADAWPQPGPSAAAP